MPEERQFIPTKDLMSREEILRLATILVDNGIDELRLTGGEPTLRSDFVDIVKDLAKLNTKKFGFTTNGRTLHKFIEEIKDTNCKYINFSLDSLNQELFAKITGKDALEDVLTSIFKAKELGFHVKLNVVLMKGVNDHEISDFIEFSAEHGIEVRFLELMKIGVASGRNNSQFISAAEILEKLNQNWDSTAVSRKIDDTSFNYILENGANIGFIASESQPFCNGCSRLRIGPKGTLRPCLMMNEGYKIAGKDEVEVLDLLHKVMDMKPTDRIENVEQNMYEIGG